MEVQRRQAPFEIIANVACLIANREEIMRTRGEFRQIGVKVDLFKEHGLLSALERLSSGLNFLKCFFENANVFDFSITISCLLPTWYDLLEQLKTIIRQV